MPLQWAVAQGNLGDALLNLWERTNKIEPLEKAVAGIPKCARDSEARETAPYNRSLVLSGWLAPKAANDVRYPTDAPRRMLVNREQAEKSVSA